MNCPSRTDPEFPEGYNQNPNALNADATTRVDLGYMANIRAKDDHRIDCHDADDDMAVDHRQANEEDGGLQPKVFDGLRGRSDAARKTDRETAEAAIRPSAIFGVEQDVLQPERRGGILGGAIEVICRYLKFVGPGFMVAVAYIDPGEFPEITDQAFLQLHDLQQLSRTIDKVNSFKEITPLMLLLVPLLSSSCFS